MAFVPLVNHSAFTFYSGAMSPAQIAEACARKGYEGAALCDRDGLFAAVRFAKAAGKVGVKPLFGAEITAPGSRNSSPGEYGERGRAGSAYGRKERPLPGGPALSPGRLFAFARDLEGYARLNGLLTRRNLRPAEFNRVNGAARAAEGGHLALAASGKEFLYALKKAGAESGSLFARLSGDPRVDRETRAVAEWLDIPLIAAPPAFFTEPDGFTVHRVLRAAKHKEAEAAPTDHLLSPAEAAERFSRDSRALDAAGELAASCDVKLPLGDWLLPHPPMPPGEDEEGRLRNLAYAGLAKRVRNVTMDYLERMEREITVIVRLGFAGYFLVVEDIARFARVEGIPTIGRGSGAGSLVSYCLFLTQVDPVAEGLYFERFLNPERRNPPDIDLDFSWRERDHVIDHVYRTYGDENVCMIATHNTFSARSAFRDVAKAFAVPEEEVNIVARAVPRASFEVLPEAMAGRPESRRVNVKESPWRDILAVGRRIDGFPRHLSVHCGGVVVSPIPLTRRLSLARAAKGVAVTQCDMVDVEALGLIKIDLLGNRSLGVLTDAVAAVREHEGEAPPLFPPERTYADRKTNDLISRGRSMGCFYIESPGMRLLLRRLGTRTFRDLTAVSSIIRPGVSESGMMEAYVKRRLGEERPVYAHPSLEAILSETFGVMVYQEDVLRVVHEFVGLTLGEADLLRRAMSGKYRSRREMGALTDAFFEKGRARGIGEEVLGELWRQIRSFAGYAFCKAHSASFAQLSYQVAYLKAHHPAEFFAALVNNRGGFYNTAAYVEEARRWGLTILPPDVNASEDDFAGKDNLLRCGFFTLRGLRPGALDALYEERGEGPYRSFPDLVSRLRRRLLPVELAVLVRAGACDAFGRHRGLLLRLLHVHGSDPRALREAEGRYPLVLRPAARSLPSFRLAEARHREARASAEPDRPLSLAEVLSGERRALGYCVTAHPLAPMVRWAKETGYTHAAELPGKTGRTVRVWGQVITAKRIPTRKTGEAMAFVTLEDPSGLAEVVFFPRAYGAFGELISLGRPLVVEGAVDDDRGGLTVTAQRAWAVRGVFVPRVLPVRDERVDVA